MRTPLISIGRINIIVSASLSVADDGGECVQSNRFLRYRNIIIIIVFDASDRDLFDFCGFLTMRTFRRVFFSPDANIIGYTGFSNPIRVVPVRCRLRVLLLGDGAMTHIYAVYYIIMSCCCRTILYFLAAGCPDIYFIFSIDDERSPTNNLRRNYNFKS